MSATSKQIINNLLNTIPETEQQSIIQFLFFIKNKSENNEFSDLLNASNSSMEFWDNDIDDEVWNNV